MIFSEQIWEEAVRFVLALSAKKEPFMNLE
jgi:hypothetical protein